MRAIVRIRSGSRNSIVFVEGGAVVNGWQAGSSWKPASFVVNRRPAVVRCSVVIYAFPSL
jgi:hypothetical protein